MPVAITPASNVQVVENTSSTLALATFTDPEGDTDVNNLLASVDWGDGSALDVSTNLISGPDASGVYTVTDTHTYLEAGTYSARVTIEHSVPTGPSTPMW